MSEKKNINKETTENVRPNQDVLPQSTEQTVCAPEFTQGCIDTEDEEE
ncbi:MAG: hypothetical protein GX257_04270 [Clostridiales bacterium]|mgnify:CR=1 FL=1|jgi:hypothetical protein|nr:hypothetical protein [Clostridiales bacterium]